MTRTMPPPPPPTLPEEPAFPRDSRYQRPRSYVSWWGIVIGLTIGIAGGLFYAWQVQPLKETDTVPRQLNVEAKRQYAVAIALNYGFDSDLGLAIQRLSALQPGSASTDPIQALAEIACDLARSGYVDSSSGLRAVRGLKTFYQLQGRSGCADTLIPDATIVPLEITVLVPTATPTLPPPPTKTPTPLAQASPTESGVVLVPTTRPRRQYEGRIVGTFCDSEISGVIEVFVQDFGSEGVPGEPVRVRWDGGESNFVTGLKPERGDDYADFQMEAGKGYTVEMPGRSDPIATPLVANGCTTNEGDEAITSYRVVFLPGE
jgi:hypothetical protein